MYTIYHFIYRICCTIFIIISEDLFICLISSEVRMLYDSPASKNLVLKESAKVILIKNIADGLYNGMKGVIHKLQHDKPPIINFNGKLVEVL